MTIKSPDEALITTVLPTYQRPALLRRAIASVMGQSVGAWRLLVCDNGADKETAEFVRGLAERDVRIEYHRHPTNIGAVRNFKFGLDRVSTSYFSFLSDDDMLLPGFYKKALSVLEADSAAGFVTMDVVHADADGRVLRRPSPLIAPGRYSAPGGLILALEQGLPMWHGIVFRHRVVRQVGSLNIDAGMAADLDFIIRAACQFPFIVTGAPGAVFSHGPETISDDRQLAATWPNWLALMESVERQADLPNEMRMRALTALEQMLINRLYAAGLAASRRADFGEADEAEALLRERYHRTAKAFAVRAVVIICRRFPRLVPKLRTMRRRWLAYRGKASKSTGVTLSQLIESLAASER